MHYPRTSMALLELLLLLSAGTANAVSITVDGSSPQQTMDGFGGSIMSWMSEGKNLAWAQFCTLELGVSIVRLDLDEAIYINGHWGAPFTWVDNINTNMAQMTITSGSIDISGTAAKHLYDNRLDEMKVMLSMWTPPHWMKEGAEDCRPDAWNRYSMGGNIPYNDTAREQNARYIAAALKKISDGFAIPIYGYSPQNELDWAHACATYTESCKKYYSGDSAGPGFCTWIPETKCIRQELDNKGMSSIRIMGPEHGTIGTATDVWGTWEQFKYVKDIYSDAEMLGILDIWCHHDYRQSNIADFRGANSRAWNGNTGNPQFNGYRNYGKPVWMTEGEAGSNDWTGAMYLANKIQGEVIAGHISGVVPWALGDTSTSSVYAVTVFSGGIGNYYRIPTYAFKHFSRYIRPGAVMLPCSPDNPNGLTVSSFRHSSNGTLTIVLVNNGSTDTANITIPSTPAISTFTVFTSISGSYWQQSSTGVSNNVVTVSVPASSIVTLYGTGPTEVPPDAATNPNPADDATGVSINADLSWATGAGATSHDIYFGTVSPPPYITNQGDASYDPAAMANSTTYYWRIDERNTYGVTTGAEWSFTTESADPPGQASGPNPSQGATGVLTSADLSWTPGADADSHDVYFGTVNPPPFQLNRIAANWDPGILDINTTYYWRIDERNLYGVTTGIVWSFTTTDRIDIIFDSATSAAAPASGRTLTFTHTIGGGSDRLLVVGTDAEDTVAGDLPVQSVTYNGVNLTRAGTRNVGTSTVLSVELWYLLDAGLPAAGDYNVVVTYTGDVTAFAAGAISVFGADQAPPTDVNTATATGSNGTVSISTTVAANAGSWAIDAIGCGNEAAPFTPTSPGMIERYERTTVSPQYGLTAAGATRPASAAGPLAIAWSNTNVNRMAQVAAVFAPAPSTYVPGDLNRDHDIDTLDLGIFAAQWLDEGDCSPEPDCADLDDSENIDFVDFALMGFNWRY